MQEAGASDELRVFRVEADDETQSCDALGDALYVAGSASNGKFNESLLVLVREVTQPRLSTFNSV